MVVLVATLDDSNDGSIDSMGVIVGGVVGGLFVLSGFVIVFYLLCVRKRKKGSIYLCNSYIYNIYIRTMKRKQWKISWHKIILRVLPIKSAKCRDYFITEYFCLVHSGAN